jgi:hypothetical protein
MLEVAAATGGDFYFWSPGEFARRRLRLPLVGEPVLLSTGMLGPEVEAFSFWVEGGRGRLDFFAGAQRMEQVRILRPSGRAVLPSDADVDLQVFERMALTAVELPVAGEWRVELEGRGRFSLSVHSKRGTGSDMDGLGNEPIELLSFGFVEQRGRPGHEGYFPRKADVKVGELHRFTLELSGEVESPEILLVGLDGRALDEARIEVLERSDDGRWGTALGECVVPQVPFRVLVQGRDARGARFQRVLSSSILPAEGGAAR